MYTVTFTDGSTFEGGNPADSKWSEIPNKPIRSIVYSLTPFVSYSFTNFEAYNHCVERVRGVNKSFETISKVIIMGLIKNRVYQILMDKDGSVYSIVASYGKEYSPSAKYVDGKFAGWGNGKPLGGWIPGVLPDQLEPGVTPKLEKILTKRYGA